MKSRFKISLANWNLIFMVISVVFMILFMLVQLEIYKAILIGCIILFSVLTLVFDIKLKSISGIFIRVFWIIMWLIHFIQIFI